MYLELNDLGINGLIHISSYARHWRHKLLPLVKHCFKKLLFPTKKPRSTISCNLWHTIEDLESTNLSFNTVICYRGASFNALISSSTPHVLACWLYVQHWCNWHQMTLIVCSTLVQLASNDPWCRCGRYCSNSRGFITLEWTLYTLIT